MAVTQLFSATTNGYIIFRGNSLVINNSQGKTCSFISLNSENTADTDFPPYTTTEWKKNGSFSNVTLPSTSSVLYAALVWNMFDYDKTMSKNINIWDTPITFNTPKETITIKPEPKFNGLINMVDSYLFYTRGAEVTDLVKKGGAGEYSICGVPGIIDPFNLGNGWTLAIVLKDKTYPTANMNLWLTVEGIDIVNSKSNSFTLSTIEYNGLSPLNTRVLLSGSWGDTESLDSVFLNGVKLSGPKNPSENFMCSQIVDENGNYYYGSFSNNNTPVGKPRAAFARGSYDITNVNGTGILYPKSTNVVVTQHSNTDAITFNIMGLQISNEAKIPVIMNMSVDKAFADIDDVLTYTIELINTGNSPVFNLIFTDDISSNLSFVNNSFTVNKDVIENVNPIFGVKIGTILAHTLTTITFKVKVISKTANNIISNSSISNYEYVGLSNNPTETLTSISNSVETEIKPRLTITKTSDKSSANLEEIITFNILIKSNSYDEFVDSTFIDALPENIVLVPNSFKIDNEIIIEANPNIGVKLKTINPLSSMVISFQAKIKHASNPPIICNTASVIIPDTADFKNISYISNMCKVIIGPIYFYKVGSKIIHYKP